MLGRPLMNAFLPYDLELTGMTPIQAPNTLGLLYFKFGLNRDFSRSLFGVHSDIAD